MGFGVRAHSCAGIEVSLTPLFRLCLQLRRLFAKEPSPSRRLFNCGLPSFTVVEALSMTRTDSGTLYRTVA